MARYTDRLATTLSAVALEEGFRVNFRKTRLMPASQQQRALGGDQSSPRRIAG
jgi:hypothetical protein